MKTWMGMPRSPISVPLIRQTITSNQEKLIVAADFPLGFRSLSGKHFSVDNFPITGKWHDKFGQTGKGNFDIHNVHSCHVETVVLMSRIKD